MSDLQIIESTVRVARLRRRSQRAWRGLWLGLLVGEVLWFLGVAINKLLPVGDFVLLGGIGLVPLSALVGLLVGGWRRESPLQTARWLDHKHQLKERLSTALEVAKEERMGHWRELVLSDAAKHLEGFDARRLLPYHLPGAGRWALVVLLTIGGLGFVPEYRSKQFLQRQQEKALVRETGRGLLDLSKRTLEKRKPALEATHESIKSVGEMGDQLMRNPVGRTEAMRDLAKLADKVQAESKELARNPALKSMERAGRTPGKNSAASAEELQKQIESLQKQMAGKETNPDAMDKLKQELQKAQKAAAGMMGKDSAANDSAKDSLAKSLSDMARQSQDLGAALPSLEEALAALEAGKIDQVLKDLKVAERDLEKLAQMAQALQQLQQQASQLGKDLAEQLKNGQAEAAQATLQKMVNQLKSGKLTDEQMKKMLQEISKAIDPASPYGKVGEFLKAATKQLQQGEQPAAGESLASAAKELENLMQQMADAQDLKNTLAALKNAQMCLGNGQGWANGKGPPRAGKGGKPGKGVGTWAEESGWTDYQEQTERWDNSSVQRPDSDPRGHTDRGEGELPEGLVPTKVKGNLSPGGQMPSITLKGVSIKGTSRVGVQEAITAAQSEAQGALSQDQVPRAYQGAVKDYFDDLKK